MALEGSRRWRPAELKGRASPRAGGARGEWSMGTTGSIPYPYPCDFTFWSLRSWRTRENSRQRIFSRHWMAPTLLFVRAYSVFLVPTAMCLTGSWLREDSVTFSCREFASVRVSRASSSMEINGPATVTASGSPLSFSPFLRAAAGSSVTSGGAASAVLVPTHRRRRRHPRPHPDPPSTPSTSPPGTAAPDYDEATGSGWLPPCRRPSPPLPSLPHGEGAAAAAFPPAGSNGGEGAGATATITGGRRGLSSCWIWRRGGLNHRRCHRRGPPPPLPPNLAEAWARAPPRPSPEATAASPLATSSPATASHPTVSPPARSGKQRARPLPLPSLRFTASPHTTSGRGEGVIATAAAYVGPPSR
ncbi:hypothetical protein DAI22_11g203040 [Oryza sativa Japonica Group]|nr:hypothetical protein DAI22_11g203040 [Oryza sativa Japonica Group]